ncbi:MAG TPA: hypothetical protein VIV60_00605, partial [Polyangiaceae bacterium]
MFRWISKRRTLPPGYAAAPLRHESSALVLEIVLAACGWLLGADQLFVVQPNLYRQTSIGPPEAVTQACLFAVLVIGWLTVSGWHARHQRLGAERASLALLGVSFFLAGSGFAHELAFASGVTASWMSSVPSLGCAFLLGRSLRQVPSNWSQRVSADALARKLLQPLIAVAAIGLLVMSAVASSALGSLRACLSISGVLAAVAALHQSCAAEHHPRPYRLTLVRSTYALLGAYIGLALLAEQRLPLRVVYESSLPVVHFASNDRCSLTVTQGQSAYHL